MGKVKTIAAPAVEKKFEELTPEEQVKVLQSALAEEQKNRQATALKLTDLQSKIDSEKEAHSASNKKALEVIGQLKKTNELKDELVKAGTKLSVSHKGKTYQIEINKFKFEGTVYDGKDLQDKPEIVAKLVELSSGVLSLVEKN